MKIAVLLASLIATGAMAQSEPSPAAVLGQRKACVALKDAGQRANCLDGLLTEALVRWGQDAKQLEMARDAGKSPTLPMDAPDPWEALIKSGLARFANQLKDPSSVQFRSLRLYGGGGDDEPQAICGEVNARNAYGGYVGFSRFFYEFQTGASLNERDGVAAMATLWGDFCSRKPRGGVELDQRGRVIVTRDGRN